MDISKLMERVCEELEKIAEKGLSTSNLDTTMKLMDIYKDGKEAEHYAALEMQGEDGYSQRGRKRDSMGRYSRDDGYSYEGGDNYSGNRYSRDDGRYVRDEGYSGYNRYMESKRSYRSNASGDQKQRLMESIDTYMDDIIGQVKDMYRDADTPEEKERIKSYLRRVQDIAR